MFVGMSFEIKQYIELCKGCSQFRAGLNMSQCYNNNQMSRLNNLTMSKTKRQFREQQISRHLYCSICHDVFEDPVRTICGHTFCYICIENWALVQVKCPICKHGIKGRKLEKDLIASQIVDDLIAKCTHVGCEWDGAYSHLKKHQRWCQFKPKRSLQVIGDVVEILEISEHELEQSVQQIYEVKDQYQDKQADGKGKVYRSSVVQI